MELSVIELRRSDIGFGRIEIDDVGVARRGLFRDSAIAWGNIRSYFLTIETVPDEPSALDVLDLSVIEDVKGVVEAATGIAERRPYHHGIELVGDDARVAFNWRFELATLAIRHVLDRIHPPITAAARTLLHETGCLELGDLGLAADELRWGKRSLARAAVESIELFDSSPVRLRVMAWGKAWPFRQAATHQVPNVLTLLELARELGYPVRGENLLEPLVGEPPVGRL